MSPLLRILILVALIVATGVGSALGQPGETLTLNPGTAAQGDTVVATGSGFPNVDEVILRLDSPTGTVLASGIVPNRRGDFQESFRVPRTGPGPHNVLACYSKNPSAPPTCPTSAGLNVAGPSPSPTAPVPSPTQSATISTPAKSPVAPSVIPPSLAAEESTAQPPTMPPPIPEAAIDKQPDLYISGIEVTQGIQNLANEMPLVAGRTTGVRVYVRTISGIVSGVSGALLVTSPGHSPKIVLPFNNPIVATFDGSDRLISSATLNFILPPSTTVATNGYETKILAFVYSGHPSSPAKLEPEDFNNYFTDSVEFHEAPPLAIRTFPIHLHNPPLPEAPNVTFGDDLADLFTSAEVFIAAYRYIPTPELIQLPGSTLYPPGHWLLVPWIPPELIEWNLSADGQMSQVNNVLMDVWEQTTPVDEFEQFYAMAAPEHATSAAGLSNYTVANGSASVEKDPDALWYHMMGGKTMAHELAHNVGFKHNLCKGNEADGGSVEPYPYSGPPCTLAAVQPNGWFGFDLAWQSLTYLDEPTVISNDPYVAAPNDGSPVMGYKVRRWADPYYYCRQLEHFGVNCTALTIPENEVDIPEGPPESSGDEYDPAPNQKGWVRVSALIDKASGKTVLLDTRRVAAPSNRVIEEYKRRRGVGTKSDFSIELADRNSVTIGDIRTVVPAESYDVLTEGANLQVQVVNEYLQWTGDPGAIRVSYKGAVAAERKVSPGVPKIEVIAPSGGKLSAPVDVRWQASDPDGDPLVFNVSYSPDGGKTWTFLARYVGGDSYTLESFEAVAGGNEAVFKVEATDGVQTASDTSDPSSVPDGPPILNILSPADGAVIRLNEPLILKATAWDWEDGKGRRPKIVWISDRDGELAKADSAVVESLSAGEHVLTATATDSKKNQRIRSVKVIIDGENPLPRPSAKDLALLEDMLRSLQERRPFPGWTPAAIALGIMLPALVIAFIARRRA